MTKQVINIGTSANDGTGDPIQTAFDKVNKNFTETYALAQANEPAITAGTSSQYWRGDKTFQTLNAAAVGLANVNNTSDASKPISSAMQTALDGKVAAGDISSTGITMSGSSILGRKVSGTGPAFALLPSEVKILLALDQVNNTSDASKPISSATQTALDGKLSTTGTILATQYITTAASQVIIGRNTTGGGKVEELSSATVKTILALNNVSNTADMDKPVSTATQTALSLKFNAADSLPQSQVTGLTAALANKLDATSGTIQTSQVTGLTNALNLKANASDVTTSLALKADNTKIIYSFRHYLYNLTNITSYYNVADTNFAVTGGNCLVNVITAPSSATTLSMYKNGTLVGTITIASGASGLSSNPANSSTIQFNWVGGTPPSFVLGDLFKITPTGGVTSDYTANPIAATVVVRN